MFGNILNLQHYLPKNDPFSSKILPNVQQVGRTPLAGLDTAIISFHEPYYPI
jgi:hypothetical protein